MSEFASYRQGEEMDEQSELAQRRKAAQDASLAAAKKMEERWAEMDAEDRAETEEEKRQARWRDRLKEGEEIKKWREATLEEDGNFYVLTPAKFVTKGAGVRVTFLTKVTLVDKDYLLALSPVDEEKGELPKGATSWRENE